VEMLGPMQAKGILEQSAPWPQMLKTLVFERALYARARQRLRIAENPRAIWFCFHLVFEAKIAK
jgi:hypothetical protein